MPRNRARASRLKAAESALITRLRRGRTNAHQVSTRAAKWNGHRHHLHHHQYQRPNPPTQHPAQTVNQKHHQNPPKAISPPFFFLLSPLLISDILIMTTIRRLLAHCWMWSLRVELASNVLLPFIAIVSFSSVPNYWPHVVRDQLSKLPVNEKNKIPKHFQWKHAHDVWCVENIQLFYYWFKMFVVQLFGEQNRFHLFIFVWMQMELAAHGIRTNERKRRNSTSLCQKQTGKTASSQFDGINSVVSAEQIFNTKCYH